MARDLGQGDIGVTKSGSTYYQRPVTETKLSNPSGNHVHQNLLIWDYFRGGFNEFGFHSFDVGNWYFANSRNWGIRPGAVERAEEKRAALSSEAGKTPPLISGSRFGQAAKD